MSGMRHTFVQEDGARLLVEPSHTFRNVRMWEPGTGTILTIPVEHAGAIAAAIQACAADIAATDRLTSAEG